VANRPRAYARWLCGSLQNALLLPVDPPVHGDAVFIGARTPATAKVVAGDVSGHPELNHHHQELRLVPRSS
jgi:hypothetical protein